MPSAQSNSANPADSANPANPVPSSVHAAQAPGAGRLIDGLLDDLDRVRARSPQKDRPFVTLCYAQSVDGSIARRRGERFTLSGSESLRLTHHLRARHDAILVGVGTVLADDPRLSVRLAEGSDPQPIVVDSRLRTRLDARLLQGGGRPPWIGTIGRDDADPAPEPNRTPGSRSHMGGGDSGGHTRIDERQRRATALEARGAILVSAATLPNGWVDLAALLRTLKTKGITNLMVEGGAQIITSFLRERLVDYAVVTVAPLFLGGLSAMGPAAPEGDADSAKPAPFTPTPASAVPRLRTWISHRLGDDLVVAGDLHWPAP